MPLKLFMKKSLPAIDATRFKRTVFGLLAAVLGLAGCTMVGPDSVKPEAPVQAEWMESRDSESCSDREGLGSNQLGKSLTS